MKLKINSEDYEEARELVNTVLGRDQDISMWPGDTINLKYDILLKYLGEVGAKMRAIVELREQGIPVHISIGEMTHGRCLFAEVVQHLDTILERP
jgi:hypothetical protein